MPAYFAAALSLFNFILASFCCRRATMIAALPKAGARGASAGVTEHRAGAENPSISFPLTVFAFTTFALYGRQSSFSWMVLLRFHLHGQ